MNPEIFSRFAILGKKLRNPNPLTANCQLGRVDKRIDKKFYILR